LEICSIASILCSLALIWFIMCSVV
jgi:hypothetical protein